MNMFKDMIYQADRGCILLAGWFGCLIILALSGVFWGGSMQSAEAKVKEHYNPLCAAFGADYKYIGKRYPPKSADKEYPTCANSDYDLKYIIE